MLIIKPRTSNDCNEKLGSISVWSSICHGEYIRSIEAIFFRPQFILKIASPDRLSSCSITFRATCLVHEAFDNSVEDHSVVVVLFDQFDEIFACLRAILKIKNNLYISHSGLQDNFVLFLGHFWLDDCLIFLTGCSFVDDISNKSILALNIRSSLGEHVESGSFIGCTDDYRVSCSSLTLKICVSTRISHSFSLIN
jgi:hypothetical protein